MDSSNASPTREASRLPANPPAEVSAAAPKPTLLPAFEPFSSSPFPRPQSAKRKFNEDSPTFPKQQLKYYPTPVPTSSTGIITSSSPHHARPGLQRTISTLSERVPLGAVPTVRLPVSGETVRMGRSSNSSDYQLSANRLISRVHVEATFHTPTASCPKGSVELMCLGWNGAKIHSRGRVYELAKGESYVSENPEAEIMLDVQDTRVMVAWPNLEPKNSWDSEQEESYEETTPTPTPRRAAPAHLASSPPIAPYSPASHSPAIRQPVFRATSPVHIFEDAEAGKPAGNSLNADDTFIDQSPSRSSLKSCRPSLAGPLASLQSDDFSDGDEENEENDPIVHSFGPFGANLLPRLASFSTITPTPGSPERVRRPLAVSPSPKQRTLQKSIAPGFNESPIKNHVINQLAFSRLHSLPLSAIHKNLPAELKACSSVASDDKDSSASEKQRQLTTEELNKILDDTPCVGEIERKGKDAAGKPLENEFYYVPEMDTNVMRREAVTSGLGSTGIRSVRKSHKQYFWKRPRY